MIKTNYEIIKEIVENKSHRKNLSMNGQYKGLALTRCVYYKLCMDYLKLKYVHRDAATAIKKHQSSSHYAIKNFEKYKDQEFFEYYKNLYSICWNELLIIERRVNAVIIGSLPRTLESKGILY